MFVWRVDRILSEFKRLMPDLSARLYQISDAWATNNRDPMINRVWPEITPQTIDYGIMENAERVVVIPARHLGWSDVGSWESLFEVLPVDNNGNLSIGKQPIYLDTKESLVYSNDPKKLIVTIGVEDVIIVNMGDALLVCARDQAQQVKDLVNMLKKESKTEYL